MSDQQQSSWREIVDLDGWQLLILLPGDYDLITDVELTDPTGDRYLGSIGTPEMVRHVIDANPDDGPFWISDLVLVDELTRASILAGVAELIESGEYARAFDHAPPDGDDEPNGPV